VEKIRIIDYDPRYQPAIDRMMAGIASEFAIPISSPQSAILPEVYLLPGHRFWIALCGDEVAGTIGFILLSDNNVVVKRMMVARRYRAPFQTANLLMTTGMEWAKAHGAKKVYLGTMEQFRAAQKFYEKNGFREITPDELPRDYKPNPIDSRHYARNI
jgi:N-acetylglutamate synthase-like GNAT family acetyltransferase